MSTSHWFMLWYSIGVISGFILSYHGNKYSENKGFVTVRDFFMSLTFGGILGFIMIPVGFLFLNSRYEWIDFDEICDKKLF